MNGRLVGRAGGAPRSVLILVVLLAAAIGALILARSREPVSDFTLGGPLFPLEGRDVEGLLLTRQGAQYRLDRTPAGRWSLTGAVSDYVDTLAVIKLINTLTTAKGGPLLPGTEVEDRRYEFNGPESIRLTVFAAQGRSISLALGTANPIGGNYYGSGAGRKACFMVSGTLRATLVELPGSVQSRVLLPVTDRSLVDRVDLGRGDRTFPVERRDGRWWLLMPPTGPASLGADVAAYQALYTDRRVTDRRGDWILASSAAMDLQIYQASDIIVREIKPPAASAALLEEWGLDPPWRGVTLHGQGLNPDPNADSSDRMVIAFGPALSPELVPALRRGNVLVTDNEALGLLDQPLGALVHRTALTFLVMKADVVELSREGRLLVRGERIGVAETAEGRKAWRTTFPPLTGLVGVTALSETDHNGLSQGLVVDLDRIPILTVLPPTDDPLVLEDRERVRVKITYGTGKEVRTEVVEFGFIAEDHLPAGSAPLAVNDDQSPAVGAWFPASGKLLQIPPQTLVTARNLVQFAPAAN